MPRSYAFIDGAAFEVGVLPIFKDLDTELEDINWATLTRNADRIFYFDALPVKKETDSDSDFEKKIEQKKRTFGFLKRVPNMHVREGFTRVKSNSNRPQLTQKGVDIALACEVLLHSHLENIEIARLFLNDLDFCPLLESLTSTRVRTELFYIAGKTADELLEVADISEEVTHYNVFDSLPQKNKRTFAFESCNVTEYPDSILKQSGMGQYGPIQLWHSVSGDKYILDGLMESETYCCKCRSAELLIAHFNKVGVGPIIWIPGLLTKLRR